MPSNGHYYAFKYGTCRCGEAATHEIRNTHNARMQDACEFCAPLIVSELQLADTKHPCRSCGKWCGCEAELACKGCGNCPPTMKQHG